MAPSSSTVTLAKEVSLFHTLSRWYSDPKGDVLIADNPAYDQIAVDWLANEIRSQSGTNFIQAMAYSWHYGPRRLLLLQNQLASEGYEFVTLNEFNKLYHDSVGTPVSSQKIQLELGKPISASGVWNADTSGTFSPEKAIDTSLSSYWASNADGKSTWIQIDLGDTKLIKHAYIYWQTGGTYKIEISIDGTNYAQIANGIANDYSWSVNDFSGGLARYVRISTASLSDSQYRSIYQIDVRE